MSPSAGTMLLQQIVPLIARAIARGAVKPTGAEDMQELEADGTALAAMMVDRLETKGKVVPPSSIAYYTLQALKSGRRSGYAGHMDAMCPAASLNRAVHVKSMDEVLGVDPEYPTHDLTFHDLLASGGESADITAGRKVDWDEALDQMDDRMRGVLAGTAEGVGTGEMALRYEVSAPRICQVREAAGEKIQEAWGGDPVKDAGVEARWNRHVRSYAQRHACRAARAAEWRG